MKVGIGALLWVLSAGGPAWAEVQLTATTVADHLSPSGPVAGSVLVGLWLGRPQQRIALTRLKLALPEHSSKAVCVTANTRDGEYWLRGTFPVSAGAPDVGLLVFPSSYAEKLSDYPLADLGVRAELKPACTDPSPGLLVPALAGDEATVTVAVNSQRAVKTAATLEAADGTVLDRQDCARIEADRNTAFDRLCALGLPARLTPEPYTLVLQRLTRAGDIETNRYPLGLAYPGREGGP